MRLLKSEENSTTLACFSPQVMALTFALELILLLYVIVKFGLKSLPLRLVGSLLFFLAMFQLAEYGVCETFGLSDTVWAKVGFASITMLPAIGVHLVQALRKDKSLLPTYISYALAGLFIVAFVVFDSFDAIGCNGNYAIFDLKPKLGGSFFVYYYMLLLVTINMALQGYKTAKSDSLKKVFMAISLGYASFVVPASVIHLLFEGAAQGGLPSIMCGFALIFAFILGLYIAKRVPNSD